MLVAKLGKVMLDPLLCKKIPMNFFFTRSYVAAYLCAKKNVQPFSFRKVLFTSKFFRCMVSKVNYEHPLYCFCLFIEILLSNVVCSENFKLI